MTQTLADAFCPCLPVFQMVPFVSNKGDRRARFLRRVSHTDTGTLPPHATNTYTLPTCGPAQPTGPKG